MTYEQRMVLRYMALIRKDTKERERQEQLNHESGLRKDNKFSGIYPLLIQKPNNMKQVTDKKKTDKKFKEMVKKNMAAEIKITATRTSENGKMKTILNVVVATSVSNYEVLGFIEAAKAQIIASLTKEGVKP